MLRQGRPADETIFAGDDRPLTVHMAATVAGEIVAVATVTPEPCRADPHDADWQLRGMATAEAFRGCGIGSALLTECVRRVQARGGWRLWCNGRTSALGFYQGHGFRILGDEFTHPHTGPHYVLVRDLNDRSRP